MDDEARRRRGRRSRIRRSLSRRRVLVSSGALALVVAGYTGWLLWQVLGDLRSAEDAFDDLSAAVADGDPAARERALDELEQSASSARDGTDGLWWSVLTKVPLYGDDLAGIEAVSDSLDGLGAGGFPSLQAALEMVDERPLADQGRVDLGLLVELEAPVSRAHAAFESAAAAVVGLDSSGYVGFVRDRFDSYVSSVTGAADALDAATIATQALPDLLGAAGPRDYLLVLQNNAEIRASGGLSGSWSRVHADGGELSIDEQGSAADFPIPDKPIIALTGEELALYGDPMGRYFQDPGFTPDYPRAAELLAAFWTKKNPDRPLDGVVSIDPVGMSYLLEGTGPVKVETLSLTADNVIDVLLSEVYQKLPPSQQDEAFEVVVKAVFDVLVDDVAKPLTALAGLDRAAEEGRFLVSAFDEVDAERIAGSDVLGRLSGDDGAVPHVDIGLNDATGSKMSYYLRYESRVDATLCSAARQSLEGSISLHQTIEPAEVALLPAYISGGGRFGIGVGSQAVAVRIYGPYGGSIDSVSVVGVEQDVDVIQIDGRPAATIAIVLTGLDPVEVSFTMQTRAGQTADGVVGVTPGVTPEDPDSTFTSAC